MPQGGQGMGRQGGGGPGMGRQRRGMAPVACVCPQCGYEEPKKAGVPCRSIKCPKCDIPLMGK